jgi:hypothetical protein
MATKTEVSSGSLEAGEVQDRELLELAAKAAGLRIDFEDALEFGSRADLRYFDDETGDFWNPLVSDGDALRLAVKLQLHIVLLGFGDVVNGKDEIVIASHKWAEAIEHHNDDPCAATRRAIVRAAATLGRSA